MQACLHIRGSVLTLVHAMNNLQITKAEALDAYGGDVAALARALSITRAAIYQWPAGPIGEVHALKLRFVLKPDVFGDQLPTAANDDAPPAKGNGAGGEGG